jgi:hypothetical protein
MMYSFALELNCCSKYISHYVGDEFADCVLDAELMKQSKGVSWVFNRTAVQTIFTRHSWEMEKIQLC